MDRYSDGLSRTASVADTLSVVNVETTRTARMSVDDEKLAARIERQIRRRTNDKVRELRVEVCREGIMLRGRCGTYYSKQLAQHAAMSLIGEEVLINQIEVW